MSPIRLLVGSDSAGFDYKDVILADMQADDRVEVVDLGVFADDLKGGTYPSVAIAAGEKIVAGEADRAILLCGTGIGVAIAANKVPGIRATVAHDSFSVERSILSNDCQILTLGQRVIGLQLARRLAKEWLGYVFDPSSHSQANVQEIDRLRGLADRLTGSRVPRLLHFAIPPRPAIMAITSTRGTAVMAGRGTGFPARPVLYPISG